MLVRSPYDETARYVTVVRDPKSVIVSAYYFMLGQLGVLDRMTPEEFFELAMRRDLFPEIWATHTAGYWAWRDRPNVRFFVFDELKRDLPGAIDDIAGLMGVELTTGEREKVIHKCSFSYMKERDAAFAPPRSPIVPKDQHPVMMRRGKGSGGSELVGPELASRIDDRTEAALRRLGSDFSYGEFFRS